MRVWLVDAFADERYQGNPAGVITVPAGFPETRRMQSVAAALALPTTAFVLRENDTRFRIRWFTPAQELNVCGHATIAAAWYLYELTDADRSARLTFETAHGPLYTDRQDGRIAIDLPRADVSPWTPPPALADAIGVPIVNCERAADDVVIELESANAVAKLEPDFAALAPLDCRGHVVTARAENEGVDFVSRSFFPALGVDEDQVCVSAHGKLAPYWQSRLGLDRMTAVQLSPRGGRLDVAVSDDQVRVAGTARVRGLVSAK